MLDEQTILREYKALPTEEKQILTDVAHAWNLDPVKVLLQGCRHCDSDGRLIIRDGHVRDLFIDPGYYVFHPDWPDQPDESGNLKADNIEYLSNPTLNAIPPSIGNLRYLEVLHAGSNDISALPPEVKNLENLREIDLSYNKIGTISDPLTRLPNLRSLSIHANPVRTISPELGKLAKLEELEIGDYYERKSALVFPESLGDLQQLRILKIQNIPDLVLPSTVSRLQHLEELEIYHCTVKNPSIVTDMIRKLKNLKRITVGLCNFELPKSKSPGD